MFHQRVLPITEDVTMRWTTLVHAGSKAQHTYSQPDLIIAAQALHHDLVVVTRNTSDFEKSGARIINPWLAAP